MTSTAVVNKILKIYTLARSPAISFQAKDKQYWLAAMGMYETLSIIGVKVSYRVYRDR